MASSIIEFKSAYPGSSPVTLTFTVTPQVGDVLVVGMSCYNGQTNNATAIVTGVTVTLTKQQYACNSAQLGKDAVTMFSGVITAVSSAPVVTMSQAFPSADHGGAGWIVRGLSSATPNAVGQAINASNPETVSLSPSVVCSLFSYAADEQSPWNYTSFAGGGLTMTESVNNSSHYHAAGYSLDAAAGTYSVGINIASAPPTVNAVVVCMFLPVAQSVVPIIDRQFRSRRA